MTDYFAAGGWGMIPTAVFGAMLVAAAVGYSLLPERRFTALLSILGTVTLTSGLLGCAAGLVTVFEAVIKIPVPDREIVLLAGLSEVLHNIVLALILIALALLVATVGGLRQVAGRPSARATVAGA
jgi:hypothetical protein